MPQRVTARSGLFAPPGGLLSVGVLAVALLWAWYAWIFSPTLGLERGRAIAGNVVQSLTASLQSVGTYDEDRARSQVTAVTAAQTSLRINLMFIVLLGAAVAMALRIRARPAQRGVISVLGRERLRQLLFDVSPEAVSIADENERILAVNPAFCRVTGYDVHEAVGS